MTASMSAWLCLTDVQISQNGLRGVGLEAGTCWSLHSPGGAHRHLVKAVHSAPWPTEGCSWTEMEAETGDGTAWSV